jgi:hypothetical protein
MLCSIPLIIPMLLLLALSIFHNEFTLCIIFSNMMCSSINSNLYINNTLLLPISCKFHQSILYEIHKIDIL